MGRRLLQYFAVFLLVMVTGLGCARVKPWQRENLSKRQVEDDRAEGEARMEQHALGSREGADGGTGKAGGGCGCN